MTIMDAPFKFNVKCLPGGRKKRPSEERVAATIWKKCKRAGEDSYDFSTGNFGKICTETKQKKRVKREYVPALEEVPTTSKRISDHLHTSEDDDADSTTTEHKTDADLIEFESPQPSSPMPFTVHIHNDVESYVHDLKQYQGMAPCDQTLKKFVVQDFCNKTQSLKLHRYVFVCRCAKYFAGELEWIYWCSCDSARATIIDSLSCHVDISFTAFNKQLIPCLHIDAVEVILAQVDAIHDISPDIEFRDHTYSGMELESVWEVTEGIFSLCHGNALCVLVSDELGVLCVVAGVVKCVTCRFGSRACKHVEHVRKIFSTDNSLSPALQKFSEALNTRCRTEAQPISQPIPSSSSIPVRFSDEQKMIMKQSNESRLSVKDGISHLIPDQCIVCTHCQFICWSSPVFVRDCSVITEKDIFSAKVYCRKCTSEGCENTLSFEAHSKCLLNMTGYMVVYEILHAYMLHFVLGRSTMYTEYSVLKELQLCLGNLMFPTTFTYNYFRLAWYSYLKQLDIRYEESFVCPNCGTEPQTVVMDATSLAFRKQLDSWESILQAPLKTEERSGSRYSDRVLIPHKNTRAMLIKFAKHGISNADINELKVLVSKNAIFMEELLQHIISIGRNGGDIQCPTEWKQFFCALASSSSVCALLHPSETLFSVLLGLQSGNYLSSMETCQYLQHEVPVLFELLRNLKTFPKCLVQVIREMVKKAKTPFQSCTTDCTTPICTSCSADLDVAFFPSLPVIRSRGTYAMDKSFQTKICTKHRTRHPTLLPGVFTLYCKHGVCYGFEVLRVTESPNTPFTILFSRFKQGPKVIIYDNGCNLHNYCLNREPNFFKQSWFLVDRFHWPNHTGCSVGYKMSSYPQFADFNSQVVEQANSILQRTKASLSYMNKENFMAHCKLLLWYWNRKKIEALNL